MAMQMAMQWPTLPSDPRSRVQPDLALRIYRHRYRGAVAWNLLPGDCVGTSRERGGPPCGHRGSNWSGPDPAPRLSALSDAQASPLRLLLLLRTPASSSSLLCLLSPCPLQVPLPLACDPTDIAFEFPSPHLSGPHGLFCGPGPYTFFLGRRPHCLLTPP